MPRPTIHKTRTLREYIADPPETMTKRRAVIAALQLYDRYEIADELRALWNIKKSTQAKRKYINLGQQNAREGINDIEEAMQSAKDAITERDRKIRELEAEVEKLKRYYQE